MKNILAFLLMIATANVLAAQTPPTQPESPPWAEKLFGAPANLVHDFGVVPRGALLHHDFVITNNFDVPVAITQFTGVANHLRATPSKRMLQPNEKATIRVRLDVCMFGGHDCHYLHVTFAKSGTCCASDVRLSMTVVIRDDLDCYPGEIDFDSVTPAQTPSKTIDVLYAGPLAWQINDLVVPKDAPFEAAVKELYRRAGVVGYQVKVTLKKDAKPGQFRETIHLKTNDPQASLLPVFVRGKARR